MAEGDAVVYNAFKAALLNGEVDLSADSTGHTVKVILVTGHTPDIDAHASYADVSADEESGTGYVAGGETLANQAVTQDNPNDRADFDADNTLWSGLDVGTPSHAIMYDESHASDRLMIYWEVTTASNGGDYTLAWHADGILLLL